MSIKQNLHNIKQECVNLGNGIGRQGSHSSINIMVACAVKSQSTENWYNHEDTGSRFLCTSTELHGVTSKKTVILMVATAAESFHHSNDK